MSPQRVEQIGIEVGSQTALLLLKSIITRFIFRANLNLEKQINTAFMLLNDYWLKAISLFFSLHLCGAYRKKKIWLGCKMC